MFGLIDDSPIDIAKLKANLSMQEGRLPYVYDDATGHPITSGSVVVGNPTIGTGRLLTGSHGLSPDEIDHLLSNDINNLIALAEVQPWWQYVKDCEPRARVMVELMFNMGAAGVLSFHQAMNDMAKGDWNATANDFTASRWYNQVGVIRGNFITNVLRTGTDNATEA